MVHASQLGWTAEVCGWE